MARYVLNDEAYALLQEIFRAYRSGTDFGRVRTPEGDEGYLPPEVYVARAPAGGIPALSLGTDTGTADSAVNDDVPGSAECMIYRMVGTGPSARLQKVGNLTRWVYNLSTIAVDPRKWVLVQRDKFGTWYVSGGASGSADVSTTDITIKEFVSVSCTPSGTGGDFSVALVTRDTVVHALGITVTPGSNVTSNILSVTGADYTFLTGVGVTAACVSGSIDTTVTEVDGTVSVPIISCG